MILPWSFWRRYRMIAPNIFSWGLLELSTLSIRGFLFQLPEFLSRWLRQHPQIRISSVFACGSECFWLADHGTGQGGLIIIYRDDLSDLLILNARLRTLSIERLARKQRSDSPKPDAPFSRKPARWCKTRTRLPLVPAFARRISHKERKELKGFFVLFCGYSIFAALRLCVRFAFQSVFACARQKLTLAWATVSVRRYVVRFTWQDANCHRSSSV